MIHYLDKDLVGFKLINMTDAYNTNDDGRRNGSIGYFKDSDTAKAFIGPRADNPFKDTRE